MFFLFFVILSALTLPTALGTAFAVRLGLTRPALLVTVARIATLVVAAALVTLASTGWLEWKYGRTTPHGMVGGVTVFVVLFALPIEIAATFAGTRSVVLRALGLSAAIVLFVATVSAPFSASRRWGNSAQSTWIRGFKSKHMILMPLLAGASTVALLLALRRPPD